MTKQNKEQTDEGTRIANAFLIIAFIVFIIFLVYGFATDWKVFGNKSIKQDNSSLEYQRGVNRGIELCENDYKPKVEQFIPEEGYFICVLDDYTMKFIFNDTKAYQEILNE